MAILTVFHLDWLLLQLAGPEEYIKAARTVSRGPGRNLEPKRKTKSGSGEDFEICIHWMCYNLYKFSSSSRDGGSKGLISIEQRSQHSQSSKKNMSS